LNDLEGRNGHCQVTRTEMNRDTWFSIRIDIFSRTSLVLHNKNNCVLL